MEDIEAQRVNQKQPLLDMNALAQAQKNQARNAISQAFRSTAHLSNLLPTGTVLAFQLLSPILANQGRCTIANKTMTACLLVMCTLSCFILSFSDSFRDAMGNVRHGLATFNGFWVVDDDAESSLPPVAFGALCSMIFVVFPTTRHGIGFPLSSQ